jgi:catechol 2,3-dioxygenase-like lactoylglutathione lyase family enzyme
VTNLEKSLLFWCQQLGFKVAYDRPDARFSYLIRGPLQVMLCERNGRWELGEMQSPFGQGINFQMTVADIDPILSALETVNWPIYEAPTEAWYRVGEYEYGQREFLVQDPDGYLLRFAENVGKRQPERL